MAAPTFNGRIVPQSTTPIDSINWNIVFAFFDASGTYSGFDVAVGDIIYIDTSVNLAGSLSKYRITSITSQNAFNVSCNVIWADSDFGNPQDPALGVGIDQAILRETFHGYDQVPSPGIQALPDRYSFYPQNFTIRKIDFDFTGIIGVTGVGQGVTGPVGIQGSSGVTGIQGATGIGAGGGGSTGLQGVTGLRGVTGAFGIQGDAGVTGIYGITGSEGIQGPQGITGIKGATGIQGTTGIAVTPTNIYRVGSGFTYATIQSAINQAVLDGHTTSDNAATVEIYPGLYSESLTLKAGVNLTNTYHFSNNPLTGTTGSIVEIFGNATYAPTTNSRTQNFISLSYINFTASTGVTFTAGGTAPYFMNFSGVNIQKKNTGDSTAVFTLSNTNNTTIVRFLENTFVDQNVASAPAILDISTGTVEMYNSRTRIGSSDIVTVVSGVLLKSGAQLLVYNCHNWAAGSFSGAIVDIQSATSVANILHSVFQNTNTAGNGVFISATGAVVRLRWCQIQMATTGSAPFANYIAKLNGGATSGTYQQGSNVIIGSNNQVQNGITINTDASAAANVA